MTVKNIMVINAGKLGKGAALKDVEVMKEKQLKKLVKNVRAFFNEFKELDFEDLSDKKIQEYLNFHKLTVDDFINEYSEKIK